MSPNPNLQTIDDVVRPVVDLDLVERVVAAARMHGTSLIEAELLEQAVEDAERGNEVAARIRMLMERLRSFDASRCAEVAVFTQIVRLISLSVQVHERLSARVDASTGRLLDVRPHEVRATASLCLASMRAMERQVRRLRIAFEQTVECEAGPISDEDAALIREGDRYAVA